MRLAGSALAMIFLLCSSVAANDSEDISKATKKTSTLDSYSFTMYIEIEGSPMPMDPFEFEGKNQDGVLHLAGDLMGQEFEMFKKGDTVVGLNPEGDWEIAPEDNGMGGGANAGMMKAPHEELQQIDGKLEDIKKHDEKKDVNGQSCDVYSGTLNTESATDMLGNNSLAMMDADISGTAKLWVNADGYIVKVKMDIDIAMDFQGNEMEMTIVRTTTLSKLGKTKIEIPEEVQEIMDEEGEEMEPSERKKGDSKKADEDY
tara:strand:+ start:100 stop:876 length:777 start_codon:yes stop_codon:yes gene_type:complete